MSDGYATTCEPSKSLLARRRTLNFPENDDVVICVTSAEEGIVSLSDSTLLPAPTPNIVSNNKDSLFAKFSRTFDEKRQKTDCLDSFGSANLRGDCASNRLPATLTSKRVTFPANTNSAKVFATGKNFDERHDTFANILTTQNSPGYLFETLRKEKLERGDSIDGERTAADEEWQPSSESYFGQKEDFITRKNAAASKPCQSLRPPSEVVISTSTERRYSAVLHQFMLKNGLVTPQSEGSLLVRQADQAQQSDPSYVSWASVDEEQSPALDGTFSVLRESPAFATPVTASEVSTPGTWVPPSAESFTLKSAFTPNTLSANTPDPRSTLAAVDVSLHSSHLIVSGDVKDVNKDVHGDSNVKGIVIGNDKMTSANANAAAAAAAQEELLTTDDSRSTSHFRTPNASSDAAFETPTSGLSTTRITPVVSWRRQVFVLGAGGAPDELRKRSQLKMLAVVLLVGGLVTVLASVIALIIVVLQDRS